MPNTLSRPYIQGVQSALAIPLFDPAEERRNRGRFLREDIPELALANALYVGSGIYPARAWTLVRRADYLRLNPYSISLQLTFDDFRNPPLTFTGLTVVQARCVSRGRASDPDSVYLVELTDRRGVILSPWGAQATASKYNCRAPAYPDEYYTGSLQAGVNVYSWSYMVQDLWQQMPLLGTYPGLPGSRSDVPEGWYFPGVPLLPALGQVLDYLACTIAVDPTAAAPYTIVALADGDSAFLGMQSDNAGFLEDSQDYIDAGSGRVPGSLTIYFHRRNTYYGTEETVRRDGQQWETAPLYAVTVAAPAPYNASAGTAHVWSGFTVRYDVDGSPVAADVATAAVIAQSEADNYYEYVTRGTAGYLRQVYTGILPFRTGSRCDGVCWRSDYREGRHGWKTVIVRGPVPAWREVDIAREE